MNIRIEQPCPQCGGAVTLSDSDRLLTCPYCKVKNFLQTRGPFRYVLPNRVVAEKQEQIIHAPYLRFKGNVFSVTDAGIVHRMADITQEGSSLSGLPVSLGLRPQAMKLLRAHKDIQGRFLPSVVNPGELLDKAARLQALFDTEEKNPHHRAYIGETISLIYLPLLPRHDGLFDAVLGERVGKTPLPASLQSASPFKPEWQMQFLAALCPSCGGNLNGEGDCLVQICGNCWAAWQIGRKGLEKVVCMIAPNGEDTALHLPFWKIAAKMPAVAIQTFADFIRLTNQPMVVRKEWEHRAMQFWIPAFNLRPELFLRTGKQITVSQWRLAKERELRSAAKNLHPVTLPLSEAKQSLKIVLAAAAMNKQSIFPRLPEVQPESSSAVLVYLPFKDRQHDWVQSHTSAVIAKSILQVGRTL